jgi:hypothetical protein
VRRERIERFAANPRPVVKIAIGSGHPGHSSRTIDLYVYRVRAARQNHWQRRRNRNLSFPWSGPFFSRSGLKGATEMLCNRRLGVTLVAGHSAFLYASRRPLK